MKKLSKTEAELKQSVAYKKKRVTEKELFIALQSMENNKSPGNDGLTKEFYITFWNEI